MKRTSLHTLGAVVCATVLAVTMAGCGSSDKGSKGSTLSDSDFKTQANAICKTANADIAAIDTKIGAATSDDETKTQFDAFTARVDKLVGDLKALKVPADLKDDVTSLLDTVSGVITSAKSQGPSFLQQQTDPFAEADTKATALGLNECAGNTDDSASDGSSTGSSSGTTPLSAEEFKTQANAICKAANTQMDALNPGTNASDAKLDQAYTALAGVIEAEVTALRVLTPPDDLKADVEALLTSVSDAAELVKQQGHQIATAATSPFADADAKATALGLDTCAR